MNLKKALKWIVFNPMEIIAGVALTGSVLVTFVNSILRYFFNKPWNASYDITILCFVYVVFCGAAAAYKRKMHYGITTVIEHMSPKAQLVVTAITHIFLILILILSAYLSVKLMNNAVGKVMTNINLSYRWYDFSALLGFGFMAIYEIEQTIEFFQGLKHSKKED